MEQTHKRWVVKPMPPSISIQTLSKEINVNPVLATVLLQRGMATFEDAKRFFNPSLEDLHSPFDMADMTIAAQRVVQAIVQKEKIMVYGDYDVDGTTSVAMMVQFLRQMEVTVDYYVPDRFVEGYGVSIQGIQTAHAWGANLIISLDCGIKSADPVALARSLGMDFIICDHHQVGELLPIATAVLDPKRADCAYPFKELSGCGVGFKLIQAVLLTLNLPQTIAYAFLDLVAVSIASDIVPMVGENRILAYHGLKKLNANPAPGLKALAFNAGLDRELTISTIVFGIGPRINASGRIGHASKSVDILIEPHLDTAIQKASSIQEKNQVRKDLDKSITEMAKAQIMQDERFPNQPANVVFDADWHKGVVGIVASRCIEFHHRPTIVLTKSDEKWAGSARSIPGIDLYECLCECEEALIQFGGHTFAAGMTLKEENIGLLKTLFSVAVEKRLTEEMKIPAIEIDAKISLDQISGKMVDVLERMQPFGPGHMQPVFWAEGVDVNISKSKILKESHVKLVVSQHNSPPFEAIGFQMASQWEACIPKEKLSICFTMAWDFYNGNKSLKLFLKDIKPYH